MHITEIIFNLLHFKFNISTVGTLQTAAATELPQISLSSSLPDGQGVCPEEEIKFTCVTNGSASHAWMSDEFIGSGGIQLEFASFDSPGAVRRNPSSPMNGDPCETHCEGYPRERNKRNT